jgi:cell wall-associated NlpC family hydrolase
VAAAAAAAARNSTSTTAGSSSPAQLAISPPTFSPPPPVGQGASGAVAAAESRVGDPYVWGAAGPNAFDCSGLTMWSYEQVGISLPHFSGAQYADTTHIPMSDLQPGDLVFPSDPSQHVAMYVGNGEIIEAPYTGATVHIIPMSSWFVLAGRVG